MSKFADWLNQLDMKLMYSINLRRRTPFLDRFMRKYTHLGGATFHIGIMLILSFFVSFGWEALTSLAVSHIFVQILKFGVTRKRPYLVDGQIRVVENPLKDYSFPSGHTTAAFSSMTTVCLAIPGLTFILAPMACMVGWSRMYLGLHYPSDVLVGAILGIVSGIAVHPFFV